MYKLSAMSGLTFQDPMNLSCLLYHVCALENAGYRTLFFNLDDDIGGETADSLVDVDLLECCEDTGVYTIVDDSSTDY